MRKVLLKCRVKYYAPILFAKNADIPAKNKIKKDKNTCTKVKVMVTYPWVKRCGDNVCCTYSVVEFCTGGR